MVFDRRTQKDIVGQGIYENDGQKIPAEAGMGKGGEGTIMIVDTQPQIRRRYVDDNDSISHLYLDAPPLCLIMGQSYPRGDTFGKTWFPMV